jgi:hypothetical protein
MDYYRKIFNGAGWFIPPYMQMGYMGQIAKDISESDGSNLESHLNHMYCAANLAAMVTSRYPVVPYVSEYIEIISEAIEAHFLGLHHVAVSGLIPVIEGAGRKIAESKGIDERYVKNVFCSLADFCKEDVTRNNIGAVDEICSMLDSFTHFTKENLYVNSERYSHNDKTNRHGILHGAFTDIDYGSPINFYKAIGAIDFLCFVVSIRASISFFAPNETEASKRLTAQYDLLTKLDLLKKTAINSMQPTAEASAD